jgi:hypothetical protein
LSGASALVRLMP